MNRPRHPRSHGIKDLNWDQKTGKYTITESGITYLMPLESTRLLKQSFINNAACRSVADWYNQLDSVDRKSVERIGAQDQKPDDFFPDPDYD